MGIPWRGTTREEGVMGKATSKARSLHRRLVIEENRRLAGIPSRFQPILDTLRSKGIRILRVPRGQARY